MKKIILIVAFILLAIPASVNSDGMERTAKVLVTPETIYCTADCVTREEVFVKDEVSISCEVTYCRNEQCDLKPSSILNCKLLK